MACVYTYNGRDYTASELQKLIASKEFEGLIGETLPPFLTEGKVDVSKTVFKYLDEAVRERKGIRKNAAKNYYYANQKASGANSYAQAVLSIKKINRIFDLPVLGTPVKIQTATGIKYRIPILTDNIVAIQGAYENKGEFESDELIISSKKAIKYTALEETYKAQKRDLHKKLAQEYSKKKKARADGDIVAVKRFDDKAEKLKETIGEIDNKLTNLTKVSSLENLLPFAKDHLEEIAKIFASGDLSVDTIAYVDRIIRLWQKAGDFNLSEGQPHIFFTDAELAIESLKYGGTDASGAWVNGFAYYKQQMDHYAGLLREFQEERITEFVQKYTNSGLSTFEIYKAITDSNEFAASTLSLAETKDPMLQALAIAIKQQNTKARRDASVIVEEVDTLVEKIKPKLQALKTKDIYDIFKQKDKDGNETGDLVMRYSVEYFDEKDRLFRIAESSGRPKHWEKYFNWRRANETMFDVRKLFPKTKASGIYRYNQEMFTLDQVNAHKAELEKTLGTRGYNKLIDRLEKKIEEFELDYELAKDRIDADISTSAAEKAELLDTWDKVNSPYWASAKIIDNKKVTQIATGKSIIVQGHHRSYSVPKRFDATGKKTAWYDNSFELIENDNDLLEFYEFIVDTLYNLNSMLPSDVRRNIKMNSIPALKKSIAEKFGSDHYGKTAAIGIWDTMKEVLRSEDLSAVNTVDINPATGKEEKNIKFHLLSNHRKEFEQRLETAKIRYRIDNKKAPDVDAVKKLEKEILDQMAQNKSFDLGKILKLYAFTAYSFHHKSIIEDYVKLLEQQFYTRKEQYTNAAGAALVLKSGAKAKKEGLGNYKAMLEYALKHFYNLRAQEVEGKTETKILTSEEKTRKKELENLIAANKDAYTAGTVSKTVYDTQAKVLDDQLNELGGVLTGSGIANGAIKWMQLKALGWNILAGIANMGFGVVSNIIEAGDGRLFKGSHYAKAVAMTMHSVLRNFSFNGIQTPTAKKIRALMDKLDILKDASDEMYKATSRSLLGTNKLRWLDPYQIQKRTEYVNQAPVMIAMMLNEEHYITDLAGVKHPLWDAFDDNGNWKESEFGKEPEDIILDTKVRIDQAIKKTHGNYDPDSPLMVKKKSMLRLAAQFRTWMFEGFFNRFGAEYHDYSIGYKRKGRYRSGIATFSWASGTSLAWWEQSLLMSRELCRRIMFGHVIKKAERKGQFMGKDYEFSEVDYANLSANINEFLLYISATILLAGLKAAAKDDEDKNMALNMLINELLRVQTDIAFYANPSAMETLLKRPVPAMSLISDGGALMTAIGKAMVGQDEIGSGVYAGDSRLFRETAQFLPGTTQAHKIYASGIQLFDK